MAILMGVGAGAASAADVIGAHGARLSGHLGPPRFTALPLKDVSTTALRAEIAANATVKTWSSSITSGLGGTFTYRMVGNSPLVKESNPVTNVTADVIPVKLTFKDSGVSFDPTKADPGCLNGSGSPDSLLLNSSIFGKHSYTVSGKSLGTVQYLDGFQREEFAKYILNSGAINPGYHVNLSPVHNEPKVSVSVNPSAGFTASGGCDGAVGELDISVWDSFLQSTLLPSLSSEIKPNQFPVFLLYNVVMESGGSCCIIGYHSGFQASGGVQTYATTDYISKGLFPGSMTDIYAASHEVGEWINDPFVNNATPAWGHVGQVSGCQSNLEVGDPLSGKPSVNVKMANGVTYHNQELAFRDWFYRTKSVGLNGWFSSRGTFKSNAGPACS
ncbi:MAG TPA: hypothetical protein VFB39_08465 [Solirubrobacteraceae bacterium]|nr:hypothetical protein [Solirubrobacteraceae bacterium]